MNAVLSLIERRYPLFFELGTRHLRLVLAAFAGLYLAVAGSMWAELIATSDDLFTRAGPIIGGDFIVFQHAAERTRDDDLGAIYEMKNLKAELQARYPGRGEMNFGWMYPPTMFLLVAPFGDHPYLAAYSAWVITFAAIFLMVIYRLWADRWAMAFAITAPPFFQAIITGQNGLLTASLLALAGGFAEKRPALAGIAAGLLTIKPQLGVLVPIAFIAGGCWRAFAWAAATALLLAAASVAAFGPELWGAFLNGLFAHGGRLATEGFPFHKLGTPFGFAAKIGFAPAIASAMQLLATLSLAAFVAIVWRRVKEPDLRLAALSTAAIMATPYAFYYEFVIAIPAMIVIARRAAATAWLKGEKLSLIILWILTLQSPGSDAEPSLSVSALAAFLALGIVARRALPATGVRFATARLRAPAG
ncbi:MAG: glycosyltransferase family 87 protein [Parvularculaceae bacterium]|nr:glycosyltransferase family 87 protein [Parvularculaceae bacterium]